MDASQKVTHVLDRLTLGARPGDRAQIEQTSIESYIQNQLNPAGLPEPTSLTARVEGMSNFGLSPRVLFERYSIPQGASDEEQHKIYQSQMDVYQQTMQSRLLRALESPRQLQEAMVDFWFNHFSLYEGKEFTRIWVGDYEQSAIRAHALGKFRDLLGAVAKHPAMLFYLDNWRNTDPNSELAGGSFEGLNENYARELMELHTLGIDGGYSQADVETLTRILTGWSIVHPQQPSFEQGGFDESGFVFAGDRHDASDKMLLGKAIPGGGVEEGEAALTVLAQHPATARHISYKLAQYFVADAPPNELVNRLAERFLATDGDIQAVLLALFESNEFWDDAYYQRKFKTPYQFVLSMARATNLTSPPEENLEIIIGLLAQLGMPMYRWKTPNGYSQIESSWLSPDAMLRRANFTIAIINIQPAGKLDPNALLQTLGAQLSPKTLAVVNNMPAHLRSALMLGSPEMMYR